MTSNKKSAEDRKKRLAKALKANIAKRKQQAKQRQRPVSEQPGSPQKV